MCIRDSPNVVGGIAIAIVGILMIKEGFEGSEDDGTLLLKKEMCIRDSLRRTQKNLKIINSS